jgi:phospho-N-acetylmuramoyl-pentapeptide-transferase
MLYNVLEKLASKLEIKGLPLVILFVVSYVTVRRSLRFFSRILPKDQGREFAVNGSLSEGKARGAGLIFVTCFVFVTALFIPLSLELVLYLALIYLAMLSGYFDDAAEKPWGNLKKGLIDLVVSGGIAGVYYYYNSSRITLGMSGLSFKLNPVLFIALATLLVWASINVTNCTDGVDGLCASLCMASIFFLSRLLLSTTMMSICMVMLATLAGYLWFNCSPSTILMGDAGSRALGVFLALLALKTGSPFAFIPLAIVLIVDGGMGLIKVSFIRFLKLKNFMKNVRTPIHDHVRKNKGWSDTQVVIRFVIVQLVVGACYYLLCD